MAIDLGASKEARRPTRSARLIGSVHMVVVWPSLNLDIQDAEGICRRCPSATRNNTRREYAKVSAATVASYRRSGAFVASFVVRGSQSIPCHTERGERCGFFAMHRKGASASEFRLKPDMLSAGYWRVAISIR